MYPESKKYFIDALKDLESAVYTGGESRNQLKNRVKNISFKIKDLANYYDYVLVFGHGMVNEKIYHWITGEELGYYMKNGEILSVSDKKSLFIPIAYVPEGYMINIDEYVLSKKG